MFTILDRMRLERKITLVILAIFMAVTLAFRMFLQERDLPADAPTPVDPPVIRSAPAEQ
jgi:hypothetical protein